MLCITMLTQTKPKHSNIALNRIQQLNAILHGNNVSFEKKNFIGTHCNGSYYHALCNVKYGK